MILSPAPGHGKSHLVGRFFKELGNQAVRVYIPPFETTSTYWQSILLLTVDELDQPADWDSRGFEEPTQLDAFAEGCFDQTEGYTVRPELMSQFDNTVSRIVAECNCQLTVVTANQNIWDARLLPGMDVAHRDRPALLSSGFV